MSTGSWYPCDCDVCKRNSEKLSRAREKRQELEDDCATLRTELESTEKRIAYLKQTAHYRIVELAGHVVRAAELRCLLRLISFAGDQL